MRAGGSNLTKPAARHARPVALSPEATPATGAGASPDTAPGNSQVLRALTGRDPRLAKRIARDVAGIARDEREGLGANSALLEEMHAEEVDVAPAGGQALPDAVRDRMEKAFGHDFSHVRIHVDARAAKAADQLNAHAYALGSDLYFNAGEYAPGTPQGDRLLAHELTHVVQHDQGKLAGDDGVSNPSDPSEQEAYGNEGRILSELSSIDSVPAAPVEAGPAAEPARETGAAQAAEPAMRSAAEGETGPEAQEADHADPLKPLKDRAKNPAQIDTLAGRVGDPNKLVSLMDRVDDAGHLTEMLDKVPDTEALGALLEQVPNPAKLAPLMGTLGAGGDALPALLDEVGADALATLVDKIPDNAPDDLLAHVKDARELVDLLDAVEGEEEIAAILAETSDPAAVVDYLRARRDGDAPAAAPVPPGAEPVGHPATSLGG